MLALEVRQYYFTSNITRKYNRYAPNCLKVIIENKNCNLENLHYPNITLIRYIYIIYIMHTFYIYIYFILYFLEMDIFIILLECVLFLNLIVTLFFFLSHRRFLETTNIVTNSSIDSPSILRKYFVANS